MLAPRFMRVNERHTSSADWRTSIAELRSIRNALRRSSAMFDAAPDARSNCRIATSARSRCRAHGPRARCHRSFVYCAPRSLQCCRSRELQVHDFSAGLTRCDAYSAFAFVRSCGPNGAECDCGILRFDDIGRSPQPAGRSCIALYVKCGNRRCQ